jgi:hypothetical protein
LPILSYFLTATAVKCYTSSGRHAETPSARR